MSPYKCQYCKNNFATKSNLKTHTLNAQYCISKRPTTNNPTFVCIGCDKNLSSKRMKIQHESRCTNVIINQFQSKLHEKDQIINEQKEHIRELQNKLENIAIKASIKPTTTNNTIIQNLQPITQEHIESTVPHLTIEHIKKGPKGYAEYALEHPLHNRVVCVDYSRRKIKYKDEHGNTITDPEMNKLSQQLFQSINDRNTRLITQYMNQLMSQVEYPEEVMSDMAEYMTMVKQGARGEKTELHHEFVKNVCSSTL